MALCETRVLAGGEFRRGGRNVLVMGIQLLQRLPFHNKIIMFIPSELSLYYLSITYCYLLIIIKILSYLQEAYCSPLLFFEVSDLKTNSMAAHG